MAEMVVVQILDALVEADGDEQSQCDGEHVDEELAARVDGVFRRVNFHLGT